MFIVSVIKLSSLFFGVIKLWVYCWYLIYTMLGSQFLRFNIHHVGYRDYWNPKLIPRELMQACVCWSINNFPIFCLSHPFKLRILHHSDYYLCCLLWSFLTFLYHFVVLNLNNISFTLSNFIKKLFKVIINTIYNSSVCQTIQE